MIPHVRRIAFDQFQIIPINMSFLMLTPKKSFKIIILYIRLSCVWRSLFRIPLLSLSIIYIPLVHFISFHFHSFLSTSNTANKKTAVYFILDFMINAMDPPLYFGIKFGKCLYTTFYLSRLREKGNKIYITGGYVWPNFSFTCGL